MRNHTSLIKQATALASECTEYLDQSHAGIHSVQDHDQTPVNQTNAQPKQHQNKECGPSTAHGPGPTSTSVLLFGEDSSILQTFQDRFLQFSPERFQEVKAQASALRGSRGMRVWNVAWLRCQEARQQLQERLQDLDEVFHQQPDSNIWCDQHYVDVVSTNVQTVTPGGQSLVVQSTPGPRHPKWEGIMSGEVDLGKRRPILGSERANITSAAVKPEDRIDAGTSSGSKVTTQSPDR